MTSIADRLREARIEAGYKTATDAAKAFGWNENSYRSSENGQRAPGRATAVKYARAFRVAVDWLLTGRGPKKTTHGLGALRQVPIVSWEDIGDSNQPIRAQLLAAQARGFIVIPESAILGSEAFGLEIQDDSMVDPSGSPVSLYPGDTVIIDPDRPPRPGCTVLARVGQRAVVRKLRVIKENGHGRPLVIALVPLNPDHSTREVDGDSVLGVMTGMYRRAPD